MKKFLSAAIVLFFASSLFATESGGVTASPYLNMGVGARASGMGEAYTAVVDNVDASWWNPGALVKVENLQFGLMHNQNFGGTSYEYLAIGLPAELFGSDIWGCIGITAMLVRVDDVATTKENADGTWSQAQADKGEFYGVGGTVLGLTYSWQAARLFSVGATLKLINQKIALEESWIPAVDIGLLVNTGITGFDIGLVLQNVSYMQMNQIQGAPDAPLPLNLRFGLGYTAKRLFTSEGDSHDGIMVDIDTVVPLQPANMPLRINMGLEYMMKIENNIFKPRVGYRLNGSSYVSDLGWFAGFTFGLGYSRNFNGLDVDLDYAFIPFGELGMSNRVGVTINVGQPTPTPVEQPKTLSPPKVIQLKAEVKKIWVMWSIDKDPKSIVRGYNVYMSYEPGGNKYYKLTKEPIAANTYYLQVGSLKSGLRVYFVVTAVDAKGKESKYTKELSAVPQ
ncbi:MAG: PorV/PorQ family protein [bacterium]